MYRAALVEFVEFADAWDGGEAIETYADLDYWLAFYAHQAYVTGRPKKYKISRAVYATEHWMPEAKPLRLVRRCLRGWDRLVPSKPAAPMAGSGAGDCDHGCFARIARVVARYVGVS